MALHRTRQTDAEWLCRELQETVPDLAGFAAAKGLDQKTDEEVREAIGDKFPKHIYHSIVCIGALVAHWDAGHWYVDAVGAPHCGERSEKDLIAGFVGRIAELAPQLVTFNGNSFDLPVLRYRAMVNGVSAPGLSTRPYFNRYTEDAIDLCDVLSGFNSKGKATLHELCCIMGLPGKPDGMDGSEVARYHRDGRIQEIANYCESDIVNTYRLWLRYELFRGKLSYAEYQASEANLSDYLKAHSNTKPHLMAHCGVDLNPGRLSARKIFTFSHRLSNASTTRSISVALGTVVGPVLNGS